MENGSLEEITRAIELLEMTWRNGLLSDDDPPGGSNVRTRLEVLRQEIKLVQDFTLAIANGDLTANLKIKGFMAGALKSLQANLRHLSWQTQVIAKGDFSQQVDFMGEFSTAFNSMVRGLEEARSQLQTREKQLSILNENLRAEIIERKQVEEALMEANVRLHHNLEEIEKLQFRLREQAIRDPLTNLFNRRYMEETLERELTTANRERLPVSLMMMDIDYFKRLNDSHGHKMGDQMLQELGRLLQRMIRSRDVACRYGGEEFVIVLPGATLEVAGRRAERVRIEFSSIRLDNEQIAISCTVSIGIATFPLHAGSGEELLQAADQAMYAAKHAGRNRVILAG
jgi:diguanylate cyclase (GGDEF)-like protein